MLGIVEAVNGTMMSGRDGTWTPAVEVRMARPGIATPMRLGTHVEMKAAHLSPRPDLHS